MHGITVVIPVWYGRAFLGQALNSVKRQTVDLPVQTVVVEDGTRPEDAARDIAEAYGAQYLALEHNAGVSKARELGALQAQFDTGFLAFLDQDDLWHPSFLATMTDALDARPEAGFAVANAFVVYPDGNRYRLYQTKRPSLRLADLKMYNHIVTPSQVLMRLDAYRAVDWAPALTAPGADDWILWLTLMSHGYEAVFVDTPLIEYLEHPGGAHQDIPRMRASEAEVVSTWFPRMGFSAWDQRRYVALSRINRLAALRRQKNLMGMGRELAQGLLADPRALLSALWYRWERKRHHWV